MPTGSHPKILKQKMAEIKEIEYEVLGSGPIYIHMNEEDPLAKNDTIRFLIDRQNLYSFTK